MTDAASATDAELAQGRDLLERAFAEDLGPDDLDLTAVAVADTTMRAVLIARQPGVTCGLAIAADAFRMRGVEQVTQVADDAQLVDAGTVLLELEGSAAAVLAAERTALNVVQRLSGVATLTRRFVEEFLDLCAASPDTTAQMIFTTHDTNLLNGRLLPAAPEHRCPPGADRHAALLPEDHQLLHPAVQGDLPLGCGARGRSRIDVAPTARAAGAHRRAGRCA